MAEFDDKHVKNVVLLGHAGSGKTTLAETMLFESGMIKRRGSVNDQNTMSDYTDLEHERGNSIFSTLLHTDWRGYKINIIDTPGMDDFVGEVISALKVADTGIMVLNAQFGVEVGTELTWEYASNFKTPMIFAINHLDHDKSDFDTTIDQARNRFGHGVTVMQYPLNQGDDFDSIVDVLKMTVYKFPKNGGKPEKLPIPENEIDKASKLQNELIENIAENDETLMELYFEKGTLNEDEMRKGLKIAMIKQELFPVFCVSATKNMGTGRMMGFVDNVAPTAAENAAISNEQSGGLHFDSSKEPVIFIYKTISEPHLGEMSFFKVYSGKINVGDDLINAQTENAERINQLYVMQGKTRESIKTLYAGDLGATVKLKSTHTNNTLHKKGSNALVPPIKFPIPNIRTAIVPLVKGDEEKLAQGLHGLQEEDPSIFIEQSSELKQTILSGQGELHLLIIKWKLENLYKIKVEYIKPKIPFRETIQKMINTSYRHKKQSGGAGQFAEVHMRIEPYTEGMPAPTDINVRSSDEHELPWGGKLVFQNCIVGGAIDTKFMSAILKGIMEKLQDGPLTGSYVRDVRVSIYDGKMHPVDSNDMAFKTASMMAFKDGFKQASPKILEPIYLVEVLAPEDIVGDVMSDLQTRRAIIQGVDADGHYQKISAKIPLIELYKYSSTLRALSQGRAKHSRAFSEYAPLPFDLQSKLVNDYQKEEVES